MKRIDGVIFWYKESGNKRLAPNHFNQMPKLFNQPLDIKLPKKVPLVEAYGPLVENFQPMAKNNPIFDRNI
jgi:hypothetical protein